MDELAGKFAKKIKEFFSNSLSRLIKYFKRLLFPLYLFPIKIVTYSAFYLIKFIFKFIFACLGLLWDTVRYPFKSLKNFIKSIIIASISLYLFASLFVIIDYIGENYGDFSRFFCGSYSTKAKLRSSVVRIIGSYGEGSGFFIEPDRVATNFHVIEGEPSPKIVFPDGTFTTPIKMIGSKESDIAILTTEQKYEDKIIINNRDYTNLLDDLPVLSAGYPLGSNLAGDPTIVKGKVKAGRISQGNLTRMVQTDINLVPGMSGGPLVDSCGTLVGMNTSGLSGLSMFVAAPELTSDNYHLSDLDIEKISVDPTTPEGAVKAFYTYLKARDLRKAFELFSENRRASTRSFEKWTEGYANTLQVDLYLAEPDKINPNLVYVQITSYDWIDGQLVVRSFEGTWEVVEENGSFKLDKSKIQEFIEQAPN